MELIDIRPLVGHFSMHETARQIGVDPDAISLLIAPLLVVSDTGNHVMFRVGHDHDLDPNPELGS